MNKLMLWFLATEVGRRFQMQLLMNIVTSTLRMPRQNLLFMPSAKALDVFASFTANSLSQCNEEQQQTLHAKAFRLGKKLRSFLTDRSVDALTQLTFQLYRNIGIKMSGQLPGTVCVHSCHFSRHYSPRLCAIASMMDSGVINGLFNGMHITFTQRLTEGAPHCEINNQ